MDYSSLDWTWAIALANRGHDAYGIAKVLKQKPRGNKPAYSIKYLRILESKGLDRANAYAMKTAENAVAWVKRNPPILDHSAGRAALAEIRAAADSLDWFTYGGPGPRRVLEGLFVMGERLGSVSFGLADRAWAELVGMPRANLQYHRKALFDLGWVVRRAGDRPGRTSRYRLQIGKIEWTEGPRSAPASMLESEGGGAPGRGSSSSDGASEPWAPPVLSILTSPCELNGQQILAHDAFRSEALGDLGWYAVSTQLRGHDLDDLLHRLAVEFGTVGAGDRDRERHHRDRVEFRGADHAS